MFYTLKRRDREIDDQINKAHEGKESGGKYRGMTYEDGVLAAIDWLFADDGDEPPME